MPLRRGVHVFPLLPHQCLWPDSNRRTRALPLSYTSWLSTNGSGPCPHTPEGALPFAGRTRRGTPGRPPSSGRSSACCPARRPSRRRHTSRRLPLRRAGPREVRFQDSWLFAFAFRRLWVAVPLPSTEISWARRPKPSRASINSALVEKFRFGSVSGFFFIQAISRSPFPCLQKRLTGRGFIRSSRAVSGS